MGMNCQQTQVELSAYIDGELSAEMWVAVERHVAGCASCRKRVAELRKLAEGVAALPKSQPAPQFLAAVRRKVVQAEIPEQKNWLDFLFPPGWARVPIGAVALVAILVGAVLLTRPARKEPAQERKMLAMNREGPVRAAVKQALPDTVVRPPPGAAPMVAEKDRDEAAQKPIDRALDETTASHEGQPAEALSRYQAQSLDAVEANEPVVNSATPSFGLTLGAPGSVEDGDHERIEEITVETRDSSAVLARAGILANSYSGRIESHQQSGNVVQSFYVELPTVNVSSFKALLLREFPAAPKLFGNTPAAAQFSAFDGNTSFPIVAVQTDARKPDQKAKVEAGKGPTKATPASSGTGSGVAGIAPPATATTTLGGERNASSIATGAGVVPKAGRSGLLEPESALPAALPSTTVLRIQIIPPER
jgi:hypothetical protein